MAIDKQEYLSGLGKFKTKQDEFNEGKFAQKSDLTNAFLYCGSVSAVANLPEDASVGDIYNVRAAGGSDASGVAIKAGDNVVWDGTGWDNLGGTIDLSNYVEKVSGKQLSTNDYSDAEKTKLSGIDTGAEVNVIEIIKVDNASLSVAEKTVNIDLSGKVDKVNGKGLSTEDFTTALKTKLEGISSETITQSDIDALFVAGGDSATTEGGGE